MSNGILDSWSKHATASELMKLQKERDYHQKAGFNFMENFPNTPVPIANVLATGYQYGTEGLKSLINPFDNYTFSDALKRAAEESRLNMLGIQGKGFDMNEYTNFMNKLNSVSNNKPVINVKNQEPKTLGFSYSGYPARAEITTDMILPQSKPIDELNQFDNITNTGVNQRRTLGARIKTGIETMRDKLGSIGDFFSKGGVMGNVISALGKRGDESTRGIAGLNLQDVFNIETAERIAKELELDSGEDPAKDPYGINIVSGFGNYKDYVTQKARELAKMKFKTDSANQRKDFYEQTFKQIQEQQRIEQAAQRARDRARSEAAYATQTGDDSPYTGGFDPSTGNYDDPFSPGDTE